MTGSTPGLPGGIYYSSVLNRLDIRVGQLPMIVNHSFSQGEHGLNLRIVREPRTKADCLSLPQSVNIAIFTSFDAGAGAAAVIAGEEGLRGVSWF